MQKHLISPIFPVKTLLLIVFFQMAACSEDPAASNQAEQPSQAPVETEVQKAVAPAPVTKSALPTSNSGTVKSTQIGGSYSYIETDIDGNIFWIATAASAIKAGEKISWNDYAMMKNFNSKALNKTFDQIMFVDKVRSASSQPVTSSHSGKVVETMNASGYSYIQVEEQGKKVWLAAPQIIINVGQNISWSGGSAMHNFSSRALDRTFDEIYFVSGVQIDKS